MRSNILRTIRKKWRLYDFYSWNGSLDVLAKYQKQVELVKNELLEANTLFEEALPQKNVQAKTVLFICEGKKQVYGMISSLRSDKGEEMIEDSQGKCELLNEYFASLFTKESKLQLLYQKVTL